MVVGVKDGHPFHVGGNGLFAEWQKAKYLITWQVLKDEGSLTVPERLSALEIKLSALRKLGPQYLAETKQIYQQIRELQGK